MADEVERLLTAPFKEIVEKGTIARDNSKDSDHDDAAAMLKAAQSLIKEGERALKKMEPLCDKHYADYGSNFVVAVKENDEISQYRRDLENLLWDFDDYVELDDFDAAKFDELQKSSRQAAPRILEILKRMNLAVPTPLSRPGSEIASRSVGTSSVAASDEPPIGMIIGSSATHADHPLVPGGTHEPIFSAVAGPDQGLNPGVRTSIHSSNRTGPIPSQYSAPPTEPPAGPPPRPPSANPWDFGKAPKFSPGPVIAGEGGVQRRPLMSESPILHPATPRGELTDPYQSTRPDDVSPDRNDDEDGEDWRLRAASQSIAAPSDGSRSPDLSHRWTRSTQDSYDAGSPVSRKARPYSEMSVASRTISNNTDSSGWQPNSYGSHLGYPNSPPLQITPPIPEHQDLPRSSRRLSNNYLTSPVGRQASLSSDQGTYRSRQPSTDSINSSVLDVLDYSSTSSPTVNAGPRSSSLSAISQHGYHPSNIPRSGLPTHHEAHVLPDTSSSGTSDTSTRVSGSASTISQSMGLEVVPRYAQSIEEKIPVENDEYTSGFNRNMPLRQFDNSIGPHSSFYKLKGFCKGAEEMLRGGANFKKVKRPVGGFAMAIVGKCPSCLFELDWRAVENDRKNDSSGNYSASGVGYRVRALQKSHLASKSLDEPMFACAFCVQSGKTMEESDSTVFFSQKEFLAHLSRHPRPLPVVPGLTIIEAEEIPPHLENNYDLHFPRPAVQSVMTGIVPEIARLPTAIAIDTKKAVFGMSRNPPDRAPVLHFAIGARIVGIQFPDKYNGQWGVGWHDGIHGAFETEAVHIDAPPKDEVRMRGDSSLQAVAKWKWHQKGDDKWLKFDKGEVIKNISWVYDDHWCWSGQNAKGIAGILPASHIDRVSLKSIQPGDGSSVGSSEKKGSLRFSLRRPSDRKFGSFGVSSRDSVRSPTSKVNLY